MSLACSFVPATPTPRRDGLAIYETATETTTVEVCGGKDCKRAGGGPRLQKLVQEVVEEKGVSEKFTVEGCDCQGECGYGPNLVVDGDIVNSVRGREAVMQALGLE